MQRLLLFFLLFLAPVASHATTLYPTFWDWKEACDRLPALDYDEERTSETPLSERQFIEQIEAFTNLMKQQLGNEVRWMNGRVPSDDFFTDSASPFEPYVQKLRLSPGKKIAIHGDFHGDIHALNKFLSTWAEEGYLDPFDPFRIRNPNFYLLFLGDYTDRGWYGAEVIYTVLRLKATNPNNVLLVKGNHEDYYMNARYGFDEELKLKFPGLEPDRVYRFYNYLPVALYLGSRWYTYTDYVQCCHGGLEPGYDPRNFLCSPNEISFDRLEELNRIAGMVPLTNQFGHEGVARIINHCDPSHTYFTNGRAIRSDLGFLWSDFCVDPDLLLEPSGRGQSVKEYGRRVTSDLLASWAYNGSRVRAVFRAHQHTSSLRDSMMQRIFNLDLLGHMEDAGLGKLWIDNLPLHREQAGRLDGVEVVTFSVAPAAYRLPYDAFGLLTLGQEYESWQLTAYRVR